MKRKAFKMQLFDGKIAEYKKRHDEIWPELSQHLTQCGIRNYYIFFDEETHTLFGTFEYTDEALLAEVPKIDIMFDWWHFMADIMETHADKSPISKDLQEVFYQA